MRVRFVQNAAQSWDCAPKYGFLLCVRIARIPTLCGTHIPSDCSCNTHPWPYACTTNGTPKYGPYSRNKACSKNTRCALYCRYTIIVKRWVKSRTLAQIKYNCGWAWASPEYVQGNSVCYVKLPSTMKPCLMQNVSLMHSSLAKHQRRLDMTLD